MILVPGGPGGIGMNSKRWNAAGERDREPGCNSLRLRISNHCDSWVPPTRPGRNASNGGGWRQHYQATAAVNGASATPNSPMNQAVGPVSAVIRLKERLDDAIVRRVHDRRRPDAAGAHSEPGLHHRRSDHQDCEAHELVHLRCAGRAISAGENPRQVPRPPDPAAAQARPPEADPRRELRHQEAAPPELLAEREDHVRQQVDQRDVTERRDDDEPVRLRWHTEREARALQECRAGDAAKADGPHERVGWKGV